MRSRSMPRAKDVEARLRDELAHWATEIAEAGDAGPAGRASPSEAVHDGGRRRSLVVASGSGSGFGAGPGSSRPGRRRWAVAMSFGVSIAVVAAVTVAVHSADDPNPGDGVALTPGSDGSDGSSPPATAVTSTSAPAASTSTTVALDPEPVPTAPTALTPEPDLENPVVLTTPVPVDWQRVDGIDGTPVHVARVDDGYLVVTSDPTGAGGLVDLLVWHSTNGTDWTLRGGPGAGGWDVVAIGNAGVLIVGSDDEGKHIASTSADGVEWASVALPGPSVPRPTGRFILRSVSAYSAAVSEGRFVVVGSIFDSVDTEALIVDRLGAEAAQGFVIDSLTISGVPDADGNDVRVTAVDGRSELFASDDFGWEESFRVGPRIDRDMTVSWASSDGQEWAVSSLGTDLATIGSLTGLGEGFIGTGYEQSMAHLQISPVLLASDDGLSWTRTPVVDVVGEPAVVSIASDGERGLALVVPDSGGDVPALQRRSLWATEDGGTWTRQGDADLLDAERGLYVTGYSLAAGEAGYVAAQSQALGGRPQIGPVTYVDGARALTVDARAGSITIIETTTSQVLFHASFDPVEGAGDLARIDAADASMDFVDPTTGEVIFEVTTDIAAASAASRLNGASTFIPNPTYTWFSPDGRSWTLIATPNPPRDPESGDVTAEDPLQASVRLVWGSPTMASVAVGDVVLAVSGGHLWVWEPPAISD